MGRVSDARERLISAVAELIWVGSYGQTTVDHICARAGVRKGSFYHFFKSKAHLARTAIEVEWEKERRDLDGIFSATVPPLKRMANWSKRIHKSQLELKQRFGYTLGCPLHHLGNEVSTLEGELCELIRQIMRQSCSYFETSIRDAHAARVIDAPNPAATARMVYAYCEGLLTQARILDDPDLLKELESGILSILGVAKPSRSTSRR